MLRADGVDFEDAERIEQLIEGRKQVVQHAHDAHGGQIGAHAGEAWEQIKKSVHGDGIKQSRKTDEFIEAIVGKFGKIGEAPKKNGGERAADDVQQLRGI